MPDLMALRADAAAELGRRLKRFKPGVDRDTLLSQVDSITGVLHLIAVATLLVDGNPQGFFLNLCRAAENWRRLHALLRARNLAPPPTTKNLPLLAALAAGHAGLADALATAPTAELTRGEEYEDEYFWALILQHLAREQRPPASTFQPLLARLEEVGKKDYASRCGLTRALLARDAEAFAKAFAKTRLDYELKTEERARSFATPVTSFAPHRFVWLEGLALLRLAERAGFVLQDTDYRYCPPLARVPMTAKYTGDWTIPSPAD